jgi:hypothetical protein
MSSRFRGPRKFATVLISFGLSPSRGSFARRDVKRTLENLLAGDVELSTEDLAEVAQLLGKKPKKGSR